jgi:prepilin-type N-terminal cleavage/methylation domain-containing protein
VRYIGVRDDRGFTLLEVLVSLLILAVVMTSMVTFFVSTMAVLAQQRDRQAAIQLVDDGMELVRAKGTAVADGRTSGTVTPAPGADLSGMKQLNVAGSGAELPLQTTEGPIAGVTYQRYIYIGTCVEPATASGTATCTPNTGDVEFYRVVVAVTWPDRHCTGGTCSYVSSTLVSCGTWTSSGDLCSDNEPAFRVTP